MSYASEDRPRGEEFARALEGQGWTVFWDRTIPIGKTWRETIGRELSEARCVIVLWSKTSIDSNWVQEEADDGRRRGVLVPVLIDKVVPPIGFRSVQAADLADWDAKQADASVWPAAGRYRGARQFCTSTCPGGGPAGARRAQGRGREAESRQGLGSNLRRRREHFRRRSCCWRSGNPGRIRRCRLQLRLARASGSRQRAHTSPRRLRRARRRPVRCGPRRPTGPCGLVAGAAERGARIPAFPSPNSPCE